MWYPWSILLLPPLIASLAVQTYLAEALFPTVAHAAKNAPLTGVSPAGRRRLIFETIGVVLMVYAVGFELVAWGASSWLRSWLWGGPGLVGYWVMPVLRYVPGPPPALQAWSLFWHNVILYALLVGLGPRWLVRRSRPKYDLDVARIWVTRAALLNLLVFNLSIVILVFVG